MAETFTPITTSNLTNQTSITSAIDNNFATVSTLLNDVVSRAGTSPNTMLSNLDMNNNQIINLPAPTTSNSAARLVDVTNNIGTSTSPVTTAGIVNNATTVSSATTVTNATTVNSTNSTITNANASIGTANTVTNATTVTTGTTVNSATTVTTGNTVSSATTVNNATTVSSATTVNNVATVTNASAVTGLWVTSSKTANYTVVAGDSNTILSLSGGMFTVTLPAASGFNSAYNVILYNADSASGKIISPNGVTAFILWPNQWCRIGNISNTWAVFRNTPLWVLPASTTFFVNPSTGLNTNDGLSLTTAFNDIQTAIQILDSNIFAGKNSVVLSLAAGTYNVGAGVNINYIESLKDLLITGATGVASDVIINCNGGGTCFSVQDGACTVTITNMTIQTIGNGSTGLFARQGCVIDFNNLAFSAFPLGTHIQADTWSSINVLGNYLINGGANIHILAGNNSFISNGNNSITVTGVSNMTFNVFAEASNASVLQSVPVYSGFGAVSGQRYAVVTNGVINTSGAGANAYPGSVAGTAGIGGQYT